MILNKFSHVILKKTLSFSLDIHWFSVCLFNIQIRINSLGKKIRSQHAEMTLAY